MENSKQQIVNSKMGGTVYCGETVTEHKNDRHDSFGFRPQFLQLMQATRKDSRGRSGAIDLAHAMLNPGLMQTDKSKMDFVSLNSLPIDAKYFNKYKCDLLALLYKPDKPQVQKSVNNMSKQQNMVLSSDPSHSVLTIKFDGPVKIKDGIKIFDALGKLVSIAPLLSNQKPNEYIIDISRIPAGLFIILFTDEDGNIISQKFINY